MGRRGPINNRSDDLSRDRDANRGDQITVTKGQSRPADIPQPDPDWHSTAKMMWEASVSSGQADFYESSDYFYLWHICEELSKYKSTGKSSAMMLQSLNQAMERLLLTEGDRRRVRLELENAPTGPDPAKVTIMSEYKANLGLVS